MATIVTVTMNPAIDVSCSVGHVVAERKLRCSQPQFEPGGGGINVAHAIHELGGKAVALWTCGGPNGLLLRQLLDSYGIAHEPVPIDEMTRQNLTVYEESSGHQYRFGMPGPNVTEAEGQRCLDRLGRLEPSPDYLVLSGSLPPTLNDDFYAQVARHWSSKSRVIVDSSGGALQRALDAGLYLIKPNLPELGQLVGSPVERDAEIQQAARTLIEAGQVEVVVVSLGRGGAVVVTAEFTEHVRSPTVPIKSKVGAGDSMVAGIVFSLAGGRPIRDAVRFGVATGAAAVMTPGTTLCRREDVERLYVQMTADLPA